MSETVLLAVEIVLQLLEDTGFVEAILRVAEAVEVVLLLVGMVLVAAGTGLCEIVLVPVELVPLLQLLEGTGFVEAILRAAEAVEVALLLVGMVLVAAGTGLCEIVLVPVELVPLLQLLEGTGFVEAILMVVLPLVGMTLVAAVLVDDRLEQLAVEVDAKLVQLFLHGAGVLTTFFELTDLVVGML